MCKSRAKPRCADPTCLTGRVAGVQESTWTDIEMPGQYLAGGEVAPDAVVYLERIGANVAIVRRHASSVRRVEFIGSDGRSRFFLVQSGQQWSNAHGAPLAG